MAVGDKLAQFRPSGVVAGEDEGAIARAKESRDRDWQNVREVMRVAGGELATLDGQVTALEAFRAAITPLLSSARWKGATTGGVGTIQTLASVNIASVTAGAAALTIVFETALDSANYSVCAIATDGSEITWAVQAEATTGFQLRGRDTAGVTVNWTTTNRQIAFAVFGERTF